MTDKNLYIMGDSHTEALYWGHKKIARTRGKIFSVWPMGKSTSLRTTFWRETEDGIEIIQADLLERLQKFLPGHSGKFSARDDAIFLSLGFHTARMLRRFATWGCTPSSLHAAVTPDNFAQTTFVDTPEMEVLFRDEADPYLKFIKAIQRMGFEVSVLVAPPPRKDNSVFEKMGHDVVAIVDAAYRSYVAAALKKLNVPVIWPPKEAIDEGFLRDIGRPSLTIIMAMADMASAFSRS